jgi:hypothetical protein
MNADRHVPFAADDALEALLHVAFAFEPPASLRRPTQSMVAERIAAPPARRRVPRRAVAALVALLIIGGAAAAATGPWLETFNLGPDSTDVTWARGTPLGLAQERSGYRVSVERAYADGNQVVLFIGVTDLHKPDPSGSDPSGSTRHLVTAQASLTDEDGAIYEPRGGAHGYVIAPDSANINYFEPPALPLKAGLRRFTAQVESLGVSVEDATGHEKDEERHAVRGPWVFEFDLEVFEGTLLSPALAVERGDVTITLDSVLISPSMSRAEFSIQGAPAGDWMPVVDLERAAGRRSEAGEWDGTNIALRASEDEAGRHVTIPTAGFDDPSGEWIIEIPRLFDPSVEESPEGTVEGPWVFRFTVP